MLGQIYAHILDLAIRYEVNVAVFFSLYLLASFLCLYFFSVFVYRVKRKLPVFGVSVAFSVSWVLPYLYVAVFGHDVPAWVYIVAFAVLIIGIRQLILYYKRKHPKQ